METKKSKNKNLENKKLIYFQIGLLLSLTLLFFAFEWKTSIENYKNLGDVQKILIEEDLIPITKVEDIKPPIPPKQMIVDLKVVDDSKNITEDVELPKSEANSETKVLQPIFNIDDEPEIIEVIDYINVSEKPIFKEGESALLKWITESTVYPEIAIDNQISGTVFVGFIIEKDGSVSNVELLRGSDAFLNKEALRVIKSMPNWKPGSQNGKKVRVSFKVPIYFRLK